VRRLPAAQPAKPLAPVRGPAADTAGGPARRRGHRGRAALFGALVLVILAGGAWALLGSSLLVVRHVQITGNRLVTAAQIRTAAGVTTGQPLVRVDTAAAARRVERIADVLSATVRRSWPDTIVITIRERSPQLAVAAAGGYDLVDEYGATVRWVPHTPVGMPLLSPRPTVLRGNSGVRAAALVLRQLPPALASRVTSVAAPSATAVTLHLTGGITVLWGAPGQAARKWAELEQLLGTHARSYDISDPTTAVTQ
jgi:cell division protein FtsQ